MVRACPVGLAVLVLFWGCASREYGTGVGAHGIGKQVFDDLARDGVVLQEPLAESANRAELFAGLPQSGPIELSHLLQVAAQASPELWVARSELGMAAGAAWQATLYPNPRIELVSEEIPFDSGLDQAVTTVSLTQPIVLGNRLRAATIQADADRAISKAKVELSTRELFGEIAKLHARILAIRQIETLYDELATLGEQTLEAARARFEAKAAPETELIRPQIDLQQIDLAKLRLCKEKAATLEQLSLLLGGAVIDETRLIDQSTDDPRELDLPALKAAVRNDHPALILADREVDAAEARMQSLYAQRTPDLDVRVGAGYAGDTGQGIYEVGAAVTLPVWDHRPGDMLTARFDCMRARQKRLAIEQDVLRQLTVAHGEFDSARAQLQKMRMEVLPAAERLLGQTREALRGGRASFLELQDAQRTLVEVRVSAIELSGAAAQARARIMQIVGCFDDAYSSSSTRSPMIQPTSSRAKLPPIGAEVQR